MPADLVPPPARGRRRAAGAAAAALTLSLVAACSGDDRVEPDGAVAELAAGLASFDLAGVALTSTTDDTAAAELAAAVADLGELRPGVEVGEITETESDGVVAATAELTFTWQLADPPRADEQTADETTGAAASGPPAGGAPATDDPTAVWTYTTTAELAHDATEGVSEPWQVAWEPALLEPSLVAGERLVVRERAGERADILGAGDAVLVTDRPVLRLGIDKTRVDPAAQEQSARALAALLDIDPAVFVGKVVAAGPSAFVEGLLVRADSNPVSADALAAVPGASAVEDEIPLAPTREFARQILGGVGDATAEIIEASGGTIEAGDKVGLSGLQQRYDAMLRGTRGIEVLAAPPEGDAAEARVLFSRDPAPGQPLRTTLDPELQQRADTLLADVEPASAVVAIRPSTGEVLAAASGPGGQGLSTATTGQYAPGSTFKIVSSLALLRAGLTPASELPCTASITVDGKAFENYDDYPSGQLGDIPLRSALAQSCNTAFISAADRVTQPALAEAAAALGLGVDADVGLATYFGSVPADAETETEHAASMIGQGRVLASPFAMAAVVASVARGETVTPVFLPDEPAPEQVVPAPLQADEAQTLRTMLELVVTEGSGTLLADVPGEPVAAKTGTAEYGTDVPPRTHAWMVAIQGDLAVAVFVEDGESGSRTAGPLLERFLRGT